MTKQDISLINSHLLDDNDDNGSKFTLPNRDTKDLYYACSTKVERNSITTSIFNNYISVTHPVDTSGVDLIDVSKNVIIIESVIYDKAKERCSALFESKVYNNCGDADIQTCCNKKIDPAFKFYSDIPLMITDHLHLKEGRGNGTKCQFNLDKIVLSTV